MIGREKVKKKKKKKEMEVGKMWGHVLMTSLASKTFCTKVGDDFKTTSCHRSLSDHQFNWPCVYGS